MASYNVGSGQWNITLTIMNTGTRPVTIDQIIINRVAGSLRNTYLTYSYKAFRDPASGIVTIEPGGEAHLSFTLDSKNTVQSSPYYREPVINNSFVHGQLVSIILHSATGEENPATLVLP